MSKVNKNKDIKPEHVKSANDLIVFANTLKTNAFMGLNDAPTEDLIKLLHSAFHELTQFTKNAPPEYKGIILFLFQIFGMNDVLEINTIIGDLHKNKKINGGKGGSADCDADCNNDADCGDECGTCDNNVCIAEVVSTETDVTIHNHFGNSELDLISHGLDLVNSQTQNPFHMNSLDDLRRTLQDINKQIKKCDDEIIVVKNMVIEQMKKYQTRFEATANKMLAARGQELRNYQIGELGAGVASSIGAHTYLTAVTGGISSAIINTLAKGANVGGDFFSKLYGLTWSIPWLNHFLWEQSQCTKWEAPGFYPTQVDKHYSWEEPTTKSWFGSQNYATMKDVKCPSGMDCFQGDAATVCKGYFNEDGGGVDILGVGLSGIIVVIAIIVGIYAWTLAKVLTGSTSLLNKDTSMAAFATKVAALSGTMGIGLPYFLFSPSEWRDQLDSEVKNQRVDLKKVIKKDNTILGNEKTTVEYFPVSVEEWREESGKIYDQSVEKRDYANQIEELAKKMQKLQERGEKVESSITTIGTEAADAYQTDTNQRLAITGQIVEGAQVLAQKRIQLEFITNNSNEMKTITGIEEGKIYVPRTIEAAGGGDGFIEPANKTLTWDPNQPPPPPPRGGKRATKKRGKRQSKRNTKGGARKTKSTRKKTTRKKRRGKK